MNPDTSSTATSTSTREPDDGRLVMIQQCAVLSAQAVAAEQASDYRTAFGCYLRIIPLQDKLYTTDSVEAAVSFNGLGECALRMGEAGGAEEALSQALKVREDVSFGGMGLGTRHDAAVTRENMAQVKEAQGKFLDARRLRLRGQHTDTMHCSDSKCSKPTLPLTSLNACGGCRCAFYCSNACQKSDWRRHKRLCQHFGPAMKDSLPAPTT